MEDGGGTTLARKSAVGCFATRVDIGTTWRRLLLHVEHDTADDLALREALVGPVYGKTRSAC